MELTARMRAILSVLLTADGYVPAERIASVLGVSARTVTREMHGLEAVLMPHGITLLRRTGAGFMLAGDVENLAAFRKRLAADEDAQEELTPDQRRSVLASRLLMADEPMKLFTLARLLNVTDSTISHDLDRIQPIFAEQGITLVRRPGLGVYVEGAERDIRSALVRSIHDRMDEKELLALIGDDEDGEGAASAADRALLGFVDGTQVRTIDEIVAAQTRGRHIPDTARVGLVVHLALAVRRMQQRDAIRMDAGMFAKLRRTEEFAAARMIAAQLGKVFSLVRRVWAESSELLVEKFGFDREKHAAYIRMAEERFKNPHLSDAVTRVARGPKRKLGAKDRLVSPAVQLMERGRKPEALATVIAAALHFDFADDPEAVEVQSFIKENGIEKAITHFTEIPAGSELFNLILEKNAEMKK